MEIGQMNTNTLLNSYKVDQTKADGDAAAKLNAATGTNDDAKLKSVCRDMESVFLNIMLSKMRDTIPQSDLLPDRSKEKVMQSMLDSELTKNMAQAGGMGLADMLYRQLSLQGNSINTKSQAPK